jgi:hypothetical protein
MSMHTRRSAASRWRSSLLVIVMIAVSLAVPATSAAAEPTDMVLVWNERAIAAIGNMPTATPPGLGQPPPLAPIHVAMVHGAIYDAVQAIVDTHEPYLDGLDAPGSASQAAAVASAAYHVLYGLTAAAPAVRASLDAQYADSLALIPNGTNKTAGIAVGEAAAAAMLEERDGDGRFGTYAFPSSEQPGSWRPVAPQNANAFGWISLVEPFALDSADQYRIGGPFALDSAEYAAEFNEVKALGSSTSTRTSRQLALADWASGNPFGMVNRGLRDVARARGLSTSQQARLFVMTSVSSADALIACWENKDHWLVWRPQTAIRHATEDGNPATVADPNWTSFIPNPGYPDAPSGFNCLVSGTMNAARAYFGTNWVSMTLTSTGAVPVTRRYRQFSAVIKDAIDGRVYVGLHFRRADEQGAWLGMKVARWVATNQFAPLD